MIKQKLIELRPEDKDYIGVLTSVKKKLLEHLKEKEINKENLEVFLGAYPIWKENFLVCNNWEQSGINRKPSNSDAITNTKDEDGTSINYIAMIYSPRPTRSQVFSFYLQEFLDELNQKNAEIIQITAIQDDTYYGNGDTSYTQGILVVYKEK